MTSLSCSAENMSIYSQLSIYFRRHTHTFCDDLRVQYLVQRTIVRFIWFSKTLQLQLHRTYILFVFPKMYCIRCDIVPLHMTTAIQIRTNRYFYFMNKCDTWTYCLNSVKLSRYCILCCMSFYGLAMLGLGSLPIPLFTAETFHHHYYEHNSECCRYLFLFC